MKRSYPLFVIDNSRAHGRARETDFISCTSQEHPFVAEVTLLNEAELAIDADWYTRDDCCVYSEPRAGIRAKLKVLQGSYTTPLLRRALKEWLTRRTTTAVDTDNITSEAIVRFCDALLEETRENLRENPNDQQAAMVASILTKIKTDYESNSQK